MAIPPGTKGKLGCFGRLLASVKSFLSRFFRLFRSSYLKKQQQAIPPSDNPSAAIPSDCWIKYFGEERKCLDFFTFWQSAQFPRPRLTLPKRRKTLVLDLDETLVHSSLCRSVTGSSGAEKQAEPTGGFRLEVVVGDQLFQYRVQKRPHVDYFLGKVGGWFQLAIFTASIVEYAEPVVEWLTRGVRKSVGRSLYRNSCSEQLQSSSDTATNRYAKNLALVEPDLSQVCLVDNSFAAFSCNPDNGILIPTWIDDPLDEALLDLLPFLDALRFVDDVRSVLSLRKINCRLP